MTERQVRNTIISNSESYLQTNLSRTLRINTIPETDTFDITCLPMGQGTFYHKAVCLILNSTQITTEHSDNIRSGAYPKITTSSVKLTSEELTQVFNQLNWTLNSGELPTNCQDCASEFSEDNPIVEVGILRYICQNCRDDNYSECGGCQVVLQIDTMTDADDEWYCSECRDSGDYCFYCADCSEWYSGDDSSYVADYGDVCNSCRDNYFSCAGCEELYNNDDSNNCGGCDDYFCGSCMDEHECISGLNRIRSYPIIPVDKSDGIQHRVYISPPAPLYIGGRCTQVTNPDLEFYKGEPDEFLGVDRFVGVEIEVEVGKFSQSMIDEFPKSTTVKPDGTVSGFELNTPPASGQKLVSIIEKSCKVLRKHGYQGTKKCGLHIHIDARDIEQDAIKIANIAKTYLSIEDIIFSMLPPSRWNSNWCKSIEPNYLYKASIEKSDELEKVWFDKKNLTLRDIRLGWGGRDRYHGLNISAIFSQHTLELRYHSGTTSSEKILNWIALNLRLFDYATEHYDEQAIKDLFDMPTSEEKFELFIKTFNLPEKLVSYMKKRVSLFNPNWQIEFNKGGVARDVEEQELEYYKKLHTKETKKVAKEQYAKMKMAHKKAQGKGWVKTFNIFNTKMIAKNKANDLVNSYLAGRINGGRRTFGLIQIEELEEKKKLLRQGMLMAVNKKEGIADDYEFEYETGGILT